MADNNLISNNPFGLNIQIPQKTIKQAEKVEQKQPKEVAPNPFVDYWAESNKVFSGQVNEEIMKYQAQIYTLGQVIRENQPIRTFKMNM